MLRKLEKFLWRITGGERIPKEKYGWAGLFGRVKKLLFIAIGFIIAWGVIFSIWLFDREWTFWIKSRKLLTKFRFCGLIASCPKFIRR